MVGKFSRIFTVLIYQNFSYIFQVFSGSRPESSLDNQSVAAAGGPRPATKSIERGCKNFAQKSSEASSSPSILEHFFLPFAVTLHLSASTSRYSIQDGCGLSFEEDVEELRWHGPQIHSRQCEHTNAHDILYFSSPAVSRTQSECAYFVMLPVGMLGTCSDRNVKTSTRPCIGFLGLLAMKTIL